MPLPDDTPKEILAYDRHNSAKDPRAHWVIVGYCTGAGLMGCVHAAYASFLKPNTDATTPFERLLYGVLLPFTLAFTTLVPSILSLGLTLWLKQKIFRELRFASFRRALMWGFIGGAYIFVVYGFFFGSEWIDTLLIGALGWYFIYPAVAGSFLCYHSHLRD